MSQILDLVTLSNATIPMQYADFGNIPVWLAETTNIDYIYKPHVEPDFVNVLIASDIVKHVLIVFAREP